MSEKLSNYRGSLNTANAVRQEISSRFGEEEAGLYDPNVNCLPFRRWQELGYKVKRGEKSIRSVTYIEKTDVMGNKICSYPKTVHLFYKLQVESVNS